MTATAHEVRSLWARLVARVRNLVRPEDPSRSQQWFGFPDQPSGIVITPDNAVELSVVWSCVSLISSSVAASPWHLVGVDGSRTDNDGLAYLLRRPNPDMSAVSFWEALLIGALLHGNGYAEIVTNGHGSITALWPLLPTRVTPRRDADPPYALWYEVRQQQGDAIRLEQRQMFHLRGPSITGLMGDSPTARAAKSLALAAAAERFASTYFANSTVIGGVLEVPGRLPRDEKGRPDATIDRLRADWAHGSADRGHRPAILEGGMSWKPFAPNVNDAQLLAARVA